MTIDIHANGLSARDRVGSLDGQQPEDFEALARRAARASREILDDVLQSTAARDIMLWPADKLENALKDHHLSDAETRIHGEERKRQIAVTILATDLAIDRVIADEVNPLYMAALVSRLAETAMHTFRRPGVKASWSHLSIAKEHGTFFTPVDVAVEMADRLLDNNWHFENVADPAAGTGILAAALLVRAEARGVSIGSVELIEVSGHFSRIATRVLERVAELLGIEVRVRGVQADAIAHLIARPNHYDGIIMNPPYGRLRFTADSLTNHETRVEADADYANVERQRINAKKRNMRDVAGVLRLSPTRVTFQKVFLAASWRSIREGGTLAVITPSTWLGSKDSTDLRNILIRSRSLTGIDFFPEAANLFQTVNQPTAVSVFRSGDNPSIDVRIRQGRDSDGAKTYKIYYDDIECFDPENLRIALVGEEQKVILDKLRGSQTVAQATGVRNLRGEVDLTLDREVFSTSPSHSRLLRGNDIERYTIRPALEGESSWMTHGGVEAISTRPKSIDTTVKRIVGRQVSYMGKSRRLSFSIAESGEYAGNSCNYLTSTTMDLHAVLGVLNSSVNEWFFRAFSSSNHVANYEIDSLLLPRMPSDLERAISVLAGGLVSRSHPIQGAERLRSECLIDALVASAVGLTSTELESLLTDVGAEAAEITLGYFDWLGRFGIPSFILENDLIQHRPPTLSELDYRMVRAVPQGGNWQNIPLEVPSERLAQIRAMSAERGIVRTTYYGRLRPDQPAYTIATYFNRPGNGTNIHPHEDRTISNREAARLQSFPDSYKFLGGDGAVRRQIGNAVPPLLGSAVARSILPLVESLGVVDLFAGAGGLSVGFENEGAEVKVASDFDEACSQTYTFNRPSEVAVSQRSDRTLFVKADLSQPADRRRLVAATLSKFGGREVGAVIGGPPCQGFSHAGFRAHDDRRNDLAGSFLEIVSDLRPRVVVLENVEGLLSYRKGETVRELQQTLREIGYEVDAPWVLAAEQFGVPQMRRRVFLVASRVGLPEAPRALFERCQGRREPKDYVASSLPYPRTVEEAFVGLPALFESTHRGVGDRVVRPDFMEFARSEFWGKNVPRK